MMPAPDTDPALSSLERELDEELALLQGLRDLSESQHSAVAANALDELHASVDARDHLMAALLAVAARIAPLRAAAESRPGGTARELAAVRVREQRADALIRHILARDRETVEAARAANLARDEEARTLESGNTTLAAYKRGLAVAAAPAAVVSQHA